MTACFPVHHWLGCQADLSKGGETWETWKVAQSARADAAREGKGAAGKAAAKGKAKAKAAAGK